MCSDLRLICENCAREVPEVKRNNEVGSLQWQLPNIINVNWQQVREGYRMHIRVKWVRDRLFASPWKTYTASSSDPYEVLRKGLAFMRRYGFTVDPKNIPALEKERAAETASFHTYREQARVRA